MNPVIRAYHTDRWLPEEARRLPEEDLYRFLIPALIALLVASLVIAFFVLSGWKRGRSAHYRPDTIYIGMSLAVAFCWQITKVGCSFSWGT